MINTFIVVGFFVFSLVTHWRVLPLQSKEVTSSSGLAGHSSYAAYDEGLQVDIAWPQRVTHQKGSSESAAWNFTVNFCVLKNVTNTLLLPDALI